MLAHPDTSQTCELSNHHKQTVPSKSTSQVFEIWSATDGAMKTLRKSTMDYSLDIKLRQLIAASRVLTRIYIAIIYASTIDNLTLSSKLQ